MFDDSDIHGRRVERRVISDIVTDENWGEEYAARAILETTQTFGGTVETNEESGVTMLACGHPHRPGGYLARCERCSQKAKRPVYVCAHCSVTCPVTGQSLCLRCTRPGPDGRRYSPEGYQWAQRAGCFDATAAASSPTPSVPVCAPSRPVCAPSRQGLLSRLLEWW